jgi:hypothetical protein
MFFSTNQEKNTLLPQEEASSLVLSRLQRFCRARIHSIYSTRGVSDLINMRFKLVDQPLMTAKVLVSATETRDSLEVHCVETQKIVIIGPGAAWPLVSYNKSMLPQ